MNDEDVLKALKKSRCKQVVDVLPRLEDIKTRYQQYAVGRGDPWVIDADLSFNELRTNFHELYRRPPKALNFIRQIRKGVEGACPMCGRDNVGTVDHYLPKANFSEFSIYSRNLIPACDRCNNARGNVFRGNAANERPVHPYFDDFVSARVMTIRFEPDWRAPLMTPIPYGTVGAQTEIVQWHINNVIRPAGIDSYYANMWSKIRRSTRVYIKAAATVEEAEQAFAYLAAVEEVTGGSPNSWKSSFYFGLSATRAAVEYLLANA